MEVENAGLMQLALSSLQQKLDRILCGRSQTEIDDLISTRHEPSLKIAHDPLTEWEWQLVGFALDRASQSIGSRDEALEALASFAVTCEARNTDDWMRGLQSLIQRVLDSEGSLRVCTFDGSQFRIRDRVTEAP